MATAAPVKLTEADLLAMPDDGVERWLIRGQLREKGDTDMTMRNRHHGMTEGRITGVLFEWLRTQPAPRGEVVCGETGFLLRRDPDSVTAGTDVAYVSAAQADADPDDTTLFVGPAVLIAEVLSPSDTIEEVAERVDEYLDCGVAVVWIVNPYFRTVTVHRPGASPVALGNGDRLTGGPELPGFSVAVADFFR